MYHLMCDRSQDSRASTSCATTAFDVCLDRTNRARKAAECVKPLGGVMTLLPEVVGWADMANLWYAWLHERFLGGGAGAWCVDRYRP